MQLPIAVCTPMRTCTSPVGDEGSSTFRIPPQGRALAPFDEGHLASVRERYSVRIKCNISLLMAVPFLKLLSRLI